MNLQMPIRLIATDMDGTLLTDEPLILPETADVLRKRASCCHWHRGVCRTTQVFSLWTRICQCTSLRSTAR